MKIFGLLVALTCADFRIRMQLCSDDSTSNKIVFNSQGLPGMFTIRIGNGTAQTINLNYHLPSWDIMEEVLQGDLAAAQQIELQYKSHDILCLESLELETIDKSLHYKIIQKYDPFAWDVTDGDQSWQSITDKKISYWANVCDENPRKTLSQTAPFQQSCHDTVKFDIVEVNECATGNHRCGNLASCVDTPTAYKCSCPPGYTGNGLPVARSLLGCVQDTSAVTEILTTTTTTTTTTITTTTTTTTTAVTEMFFRIRMQLCSDDSTSDQIVYASQGPKERFTIRIGNETAQTINLPINIKSWNIMEEVLPGDLAAAQQIEVQFKRYDIVCLESLELETLDKSLHYQIIQKYDPFAWDVTDGNQSWQSISGKKISFWSSHCGRDSARPASLTAPFQQSCHNTVKFDIVEVNECATGEHRCDNLASCVDTPTAYECSCPPGYTGNGLILRKNVQGCVQDTSSVTERLTTTTTTTTTTKTTTSTTTTTTTTAVTDIFSLMDHTVPSMSGQLKGYGCAGVGNMDATLKTVGRPVDATDKALNIRKHCIICASKEFGDYTIYNYDKINNACDDSIGTGSRAFCKCDVQFVNTIDGLSAFNQNYDTDKCVIFAGQSNGACCESGSGLFTWYNSNQDECCYGNVESIGSC